MLYLIFTLVSFAAACDECVLSKAAVFSRGSTLSSGACGYGSFALKLSGAGFPAAGVPSLFKNGAGCGACFQIRCKNSGICSKAGTRVVLTDVYNSKTNGTDFVLSGKALKAMALPGKELQVMKHGIVDVEYKRIACDYKGHNLFIKVEGSSRQPTNFGIIILYQGGQTEIVAIDVAQVGSSNWSFMSRTKGAVWAKSGPPPVGPLQFRFVVTSGFDGKYIWAKSVLPANWRAGVIYNTGLQINDVALDGCKPCADGDWS